METAASIDIFGNDTRIFFVISEEEYDRMETIWDKNDVALTEFFADLNVNYAKWSDVQPIHFKWLIIQTLDMMISKYGTLPPGNADYMRLRFLITGLCFQMYAHLGDNVDHIRIRHIKTNHANFETLLDETVMIAADEKPKLKLVVDNS